MQVLQNAAGFDRDGEVVCVKRANRIHARQAQNHLGATGIGGGSHHHAGIAALGNDADTGLGTGQNDLSDLFRRAGLHDGQGFAALAFSPI